MRVRFIYLVGSFSFLDASKVLRSSEFFTTAAFFFYSIVFRGLYFIVY